MKSLSTWLDLYSVSHKNPTNKLIHRVCVPIITFTVFGLLWCIPTPELFQNIQGLNWASIFTLITVPFYFRLNISLGILMLIQMLIMLFLCQTLYTQINLFNLSTILFFIAWIGQFWGHKIEGKKPSFFQDLQFLLIGPIWVIKDITGFPKTK